MKIRNWVRFLITFAIFAQCYIGFAFSGSAGTEDTRLVNLKSYSPHILIDLKYATTDNFLQQKVYDDPNCYVLETLAQKLDQAQKILEKDGLGLKVFDGYRPVAVQEMMWAILPDSRFVANPKTGSVHNRGGAVDLTLVDSTGKELDMPTPFDSFSERAYQFSEEPTPQQRANRLLLRNVMQEVGLEYIETEWWHFQLPNAKQYPIIKEQDITVTALGDIRLSKGLIEKHGRDLAKLHFSSDIVYANFEGVLYEGESNDHLLLLKMPFKSVDILKKMGVNALNLANNHAMDFGVNNYASTYKNLLNQGFYVSGFDDKGMPIDIDGKKVRIIGFSFNSPNNVNDIEKATKLIRSFTDDIIIVSAHMGGENSRGYQIPEGTEYFDGEKRGDVVQFSRACIDAGADLVLGHGPHVIRKLELYKNKLIAYSLGNLIFDYPGAEEERFSPTIALTVHLNGNGDFIKAQINSYSIIDGVPHKDARQRAYYFIQKLTNENNDVFVFNENETITKEAI